MNKNIIIFGSGSYVLGDQFGPAPVLRGVLQWARHVSPKFDVKVHLVCRSTGNLAKVTKSAFSAADEVGARDHLSVVGLAEGIELLDQQPLALFICVPDTAHADYLERAIAAGIPAWIVKPLTGDIVQAKAVVAKAGIAGSPVWVDYHKRFDTSNIQLRRAIRDERYGKLLHYAVQYTQPRILPMDAFSWGKETDVFTYIGCHYVDQLDFLFPDIAIERVSAVGLQGEVYEKLGGNCYDVVVAQLSCRTERGQPILATMQVGWCDPLGTPGKSHQRVELTFARGRIIADQKVRGMQIWDDTQTHEANPYFFNGGIDPIDEKLVYGGYGIESINRFLDWCIASPESQEKQRQAIALPWIERSLFTEQVLDMVRRSLENEGSWISR